MLPGLYQIIHIQEVDLPYITLTSQVSNNLRRCHPLPDTCEVRVICRQINFLNILFLFYISSQSVLKKIFIFKWIRESIFGAQNIFNVVSHNLQAA